MNIDDLDKIWLNIIKEKILAAQFNIVDFYIVGSYVFGNATEKSDIDIVLVTESGMKKYEDFLLLKQIAIELSQVLGKKISLSFSTIEKQEVYVEIFPYYSFLTGWHNKPSKPLSIRILPQPYGFWVTRLKMENIDAAISE